MHPLPVSNIAASLDVADNDDNTNRRNLTNNEIQDSIELEVIEHNSNVEPINMPTTRTTNNENQENFELESRGRSLSMNENQENIELQTISRIIDEQPEKAVRHFAVDYFAMGHFAVSTLPWRHFVIKGILSYRG